MKEKNVRFVRRILSMMLSLMMVVTLCAPSTAYAAKKEKTDAQIVEIAVGETVRLKAPTGNVSWESSDEAVVTVSEKGDIMGINAGEATVSAITKSPGLVKKGKVTKTEFYITVMGNALENAYTVVFESNGGSKVDSQVVEAGQMVLAPEAALMENATFLGWYEDKDESDWNKFFKFDTAIDHNMTLYAKWSSNLDTDGDGLVDGLEEYYGTDQNKEDTDGDGISDYIELVSGLDPLSKDTDNNGVVDGMEDTDGDGLLNEEEVRLDTDVFYDDTDTDGLSDSEEVNIYLTNPTMEDTDGDGASDGAEIKYGTNPLAADASFTILLREEYEDRVVPSVQISLNGNQVDTLAIRPVDNPELFSEEIPGYMGNAYDFFVEGGFENATIRFEFDGTTLAADAKPTIYYFNEEKQLLEELVTVVEGNVASAAVPHFSTYILLNKTEFDKVWESEIKPPEYDAAEKGLDVVFVIDYSSSMRDNDPEGLRKAVANEFIDKLNPETDRAGLVEFIATATPLSGLTNNFEELKQKVNSIPLDDGYGTNSGTNGSAGIYEALNLFDASTDSHKFIVFLTDGEDNRTSYEYAQLAQQALDAGILIYGVGLGSADVSILESISQKTGGKYYFASTADVLNGIYDEIADETVDYVTDSNGDGISDYYTKSLCEGSLRTGTGTTVFTGVAFEEVQANDDYDGDTLKNGDELIVQYDEQSKKTYAKTLSSTTLKDTDRDGYPDNADPQPRKWNISDRDLVMCASMAYSFIPVTALSNLDNSLKTELNNRFIGNDGISVGNVDELKGWKVVDNWYARGLQMAVFQKDLNIIVACRGTEPSGGDKSELVLDWANNAYTYIIGTSVQTPAAKKFMRHVMNEYEGYNFYATGHSLGGHITYNVAAEGISYDEDFIKGIVTFNGLGLCQRLTGWGDVWTEEQLSKKPEIIRDYMVEWDFVSNSPLSIPTVHCGKQNLYSKHEQAESKHSLYNFIVRLEPLNR